MKAAYGEQTQIAVQSLSKWNTFEIHCELTFPPPIPVFKVLTESQWLNLEIRNVTASFSKGMTTVVLNALTFRSYRQEADAELILGNLVYSYLFAHSYTNKQSKYLFLERC